MQDNLRDKRGERRYRQSRLGVVLLLAAALALAPAACGDSIPAKGGMSFQVRPPRIVAEGTDLNALAVGDTDGDGHRDVVGSTFDRVVSLRGDGAGSLGQAVAIGGALAFFVALGDLNNDGRADLVAPATDRGNVRVQLARGGGAFTDQILYGLSAAEAVGIALADMNGDGWLDIVGLATALQSGRSDQNALAVLHNQGNGTFADAVTLQLENPVAGLVVADFDRDGRPDAAGVEATAGKIVLMRNDGNGVMHSPVPIATGGTAASSGMTAGDIDGDGLIDLVALNEGGTGFEILRNMGGGAFAAPAPVPSRVSISGMAKAADFDGDGRDDIAATSSNGGVMLWHGGPSGLSAGESYVAGGYAHTLVTDDMDGDGDIDILAASSTGIGGNLAVLLNDGSGRFQASRLETESLGATGITVVDLDGDGRTEVVAPVGDSLGSGSLTVLGSRDATRHLTTRTRFATSSLSYAPPAVGDLNGDRRADVVLPDENSTSLSVALGNPDGSFATPLSVPADVASRVRLGDVNGDDRLDVVLASNSNPGAMGFVLGTGRGSFGPLSTTVVGQSTPLTFLLADVTGDRRLDVVAAVQDATFAGTVAVLFNDGVGKFPSSLSVTISDMPVNGLAIGDFDRNGTADVFATTMDERGKASLLLGSGNSQFFAQRPVTLEGMAAAAVAADLDRDGWADLVVALPFLGGVELLMNDADGRFSRRHLLRIGAEPLDLGTGDVDGDGNVDIVVLTAAGIVVLWNDG